MNPGRTEALVDFGMSEPGSSAWRRLCSSPVSVQCFCSVLCRGGVAPLVRTPAPRADPSRQSALLPDHRPPPSSLLFWIDRAPEWIPTAASRWRLPIIAGSNTWVALLLQYSSPSHLYLQSR
ncbi:hypothetical protein M758_1G299500 [Ceratodon purpureus]|nr:hypothetical protein M758_1G299500 [Ceratodon purpureus]